MGGTISRLQEELALAGTVADRASTFGRLQGEPAVLGAVTGAGVDEGSSLGRLQGDPPPSIPNPVPNPATAGSPCRRPMVLPPSTQIPAPTTAGSPCSWPSVPPLSTPVPGAGVITTSPTVGRLHPAVV